MPKSQNESKFWKKLKSRIESSQDELTATRIENSQTPGIPDLLLLDHKKNLHLIELKVTQTARVNISPFQVSFATRHKGSRVWLLVERQMKEGPLVYLYRANAVQQLAEHNLDTVGPELSFSLKDSFDLFINWISRSTKITGCK